MSDQSNRSPEFLDRLFEAERISPSLKSSYQSELEAAIHPKMTIRSAAPGVALLVILTGCIAAIIRAMIVHRPETPVMAAWTVFVVSFGWAAWLIVRDLWLQEHSRKSKQSVSNALMFSAAIGTVAALLVGLSDPGNPASTFNAFFVFVFYIACITMSLDSRIAAAELTAREQMLRIEYRLADLAERLAK